MAGSSPRELTPYPPVQDGQHWGVGGCSTPCKWGMQGEQLPCTAQGWMAPGHGDRGTTWSSHLQWLLQCFPRNSRHSDTKMLHCCVFHEESSESASKTPGGTLKAQLSPLLAAILRCQSSAISRFCGCSLFPCWTQLYQLLPKYWKRCCSEVLPKYWEMLLRRSLSHASRETLHCKSLVLLIIHWQQTQRESK